MKRLTHLNAKGEARMVDVGDKPQTAREAVAEGRIRMKKETLRLILAGDAPKGDVLGTARIAGILGAKRTAELVPLCHPLNLSFIDVAFNAETSPPAMRAEARVKTKGETGVEMEALAAVSIALLTIYDMAKAVDRAMQIEGIRLLEKTGGMRGDYRAAAPRTKRKA